MKKTFLVVGAFVGTLLVMLISPLSDPIGVTAASSEKLATDLPGPNLPSLMSQEVTNGASNTNIIGTNYPGQVLAEQGFTVSVTVEYHTVSSTQFYIGVILSGEKDWQDSLSDTISGDLTKTYVLSVSAQDGPKLVISTVEVLRRLENQSWVLDDSKTCLTRVLTSTSPVAVECLPSSSVFAIGQSASVYGFVSPCITGCQVDLYVVKPDQSETKTVLSTDASGSYSYGFVPSYLGEWGVYAVASGIESMRRHFTVESISDSVLRDFPLKGQTWDYEENIHFQWESHGSCVILASYYFEILAVNKAQDYYDYKTTLIENILSSSIDVFFQRNYLDGRKENLTEQFVSGTWIRRAHMNGTIISWMPGSDDFNETVPIIKTEIPGAPEWSIGTVGYIADPGEQPEWVSDPRELSGFPTEIVSTPAGFFDCWLNETSGGDYYYIKDSGLLCAKITTWNDEWFGKFTIPVRRVLTRITSSQGLVDVQISADRTRINHDKTPIWQEISTQATVTVNVENQGASVARDVMIDIKVPANFETTDSTSWKGDIPAQSEKKIVLSVKAKRCGQGIFTVDVTYKNEVDDVIKVPRKSTTISVAGYIILEFGDGWTDVNLASETVKTCKSILGAEGVASGVWALTMIHNVVSQLDQEVIQTLLEHMRDLVHWLNFLLGKEEISLDMLTAISDMIVGLIMNTAAITLCTSTGRTGGRAHLYEDGTMDFRCMWPFSALKAAFMKPVITLVVDAIESEVQKPETMNKSFVYLEDPEGQLYLRAFADGKEVEVHYDQNRALAIMESNLTSFSYSVNATEVHKSVEQYGIAYWTVRNGVLVHEEDFYNPIQNGTLHECEIKATQSGELHKISKYGMCRCGQDFHLLAETNFTLSEFNLVRNQKKVFFKVSGSNATAGFCNVTIPKSVLNSTLAHPWQVLLNCSNLTYSLVENVTHTSLYFVSAKCESGGVEIIGGTTIGIIGDQNEDGKINILDIFAVAMAFGSKPGDPNWNIEADPDNNGEINILDIFAAAWNFGKTV